MRPVQVYLDSSDFSRFSNPVELSRPEVRSAKEYLLREVDSGSVEIRFGFVHVCEVAPVDQDAVRWARERAACIDELCRGKALKFLETIDFVEMAAALGIGSATFPAYAWDDSGDWWPDMTKVGLALPSDLVGMMRQELAKAPMGRESRRRLMRALFRANGDLTAEGRVRFVAWLNDTFPKIQAEYGFPDSLRDAFIRSFDESEAGIAVYAELKKMLQGVGDFMAWYCSDGANTELAKVFRGSDSRNVAGLLDVRESLRRVREVEEANGVDRKIVRRKFEAIVEEAAGSAVLRLRKKIFHDHAQWFLARGITDPGNALAALPLVRMSAWLALEAEWMVLNGSGNRSTQKMDTDFGDISHATYAPYVDVFRCDAYAFEVCRRLRATLHTRFVQRLEDLPSAIEAAAASFRFG